MTEDCLDGTLKHAVEKHLTSFKNVLGNYLNNFKFSNSCHTTQQQNRTQNRNIFEGKNKSQMPIEMQLSFDTFFDRVSKPLRPRPAR